MEKLKIMLEDDRLTVAAILVKNGYIVRQMKERVEGKKSYALPRIRDTRQRGGPRMKTMTQRQQVLRHLQENGSITSWEAIMKFHATRLSGIIYSLRKGGYPIVSTMESSNGKHYTRYSLQQDKGES